MRLSITHSELQRALSFVQNISERKSTMPILGNVVLEAKGNELILLGSDLEVTAQVRVPAEVITPGRTTVNAKVFAEIVRELPSQFPIELTRGAQERLEIIAGSAKLRVIGNSADEYPLIDNLVIEPETAVSSEQLLKMVNRTAYAVSSDETRFNLNGVCFEVVQEKGALPELRLVATDGHRLALSSAPLGKIPLEGRVIVPKKGLLELKKVLSENSAKEVRIGFKDQYFVAQTPQVKLLITLIDGDFPNYHNVIPTTKGVIATLPNPLFTQAVRRAMLVTTEKMRGIKFDFTSNRLQLSTSSQELGDAKEELEVRYEGEELTIGFNARYILDIISAFEDPEKFVIELHGEHGAGKFYDPKDSSSYGIIMPMRLG